MAWKRKPDPDFDLNAWKDGKRIEADTCKAMLTQGIKDFTAGNGAFMEFLKFASRFHSYSFHNQIMILCQMPTATRVAGAGTWHKFNRRIRDDVWAEPNHGGIAIWAPATKYVKGRPSNDDGTDPLDGEPRRSRFFVIKRVWDVSQTEGDPLPDDQVMRPAKLEGNSDAANWLLSKMECYVDLQMKWKYEYLPQGSLGTANGCCSFVQRKISISGGISEVQQTHTFAHEVGHALIHGINDDLTASEREVQAESFAFLMLTKYGIECDSYAFPYIAGWAGDNVDRKVEKAIRAVMAQFKNLSRHIDQDLYQGDENAAD